VILALKAQPDVDWQELNKTLDGLWLRDAQLWPSRLSRFLKSLSGPAARSFGKLVKGGCQPDMLAFQFCEAAKADEYEVHSGQLRRDLQRLTRLGPKAVTAVHEFFSRRQQLDDYLHKYRLRAVEGESGDAELKILLLDLQELVRRHSDDDHRLLHQLDGRRESLLGHAEVRLSCRIHAATGQYHDKKVEQILGDLRVTLKLNSRQTGALKRRRARAMKRLSAFTK
jgi:hypothetical protein